MAASMASSCEGLAQRAHKPCVALYMYAKRRIIRTCVRECYVGAKYGALPAAQCLAC